MLVHLMKYTYILYSIHNIYKCNELDPTQYFPVWPEFSNLRAREEVRDPLYVEGGGALGLLGRIPHPQERLQLVRLK